MTVPKPILFPNQMELFLSTRNPFPLESPTFETVLLNGSHEQKHKHYEIIHDTTFAKKKEEKSLCYDIWPTTSCFSVDTVM